MFKHLPFYTFLSMLCLKGLCKFYKIAGVFLPLDGREDETSLSESAGRLAFITSGVRRAGHLL